MVRETVLTARTRMRCFCFTQNNPTPEQITFWTILADANNTARAALSVRYVVFQQEIGENGTKHIQGYVELQSQKSLRQIRTAFGEQAHYEQRRGTQAQAIQYCKKQDTRDPEGISGEGGEHAKATLSGSLIEALQSKASKSEIIANFPDQYLRWGGNIDKMVNSNCEQRSWQMQIDIYVGVSGVGKSMTAFHDDKDAFYAMWPKGGRWWWPEYEGQHTVIMDEFRHQIKMDQMLRIMDRYPMKVEYKGGNTEFRSKRIIITTNIESRCWYPGVDDRTMLWRRFEDFCTIWQFDMPPEWLDPEHDKVIEDIVKYEVKWNPSHGQYEKVQEELNLDDNQGYDSDIMEM